MIRKILESVGPSYEIWKLNKQTLEDNVDIREKVLLSITGKTNGGVLPEKIRTSKEYQEANKNFKKAFKELQDFNKKSPKEFQKRFRKETRGY